MNEEFSDARLAAIYDLLNPWAADNEFYLSLPRPGDASVLDLGCGTGVLACAYARRGLAVVGVDPAQPMLSIARSRPRGDRVEWMEASAQTYRSDRRFDLVVMTGHVFQFFLTDEDVQGALSTVRRHLAEEGRVAFETRNPLARGWAQWTAARSFESVQVQGGGQVDAWTQVEAVEGDLVHYTMRYRFRRAGETLRSEGTLRFIGRTELERHCARAGLRIEALYGDWKRSPLASESPEMIVLASAR